MITATLTPEQFQTQAIAWMKAIGAVAAFGIAGLAIFWASYGPKIKSIIQDIKTLKASATLHDKQIAVTSQNIATTAEANPADVKLIPLPTPPAPSSGVIPSQTKTY